MNYADTLSSSRAAGGKGAGSEDEILEARIETVDRTQAEESGALESKRKGEGK